MDGLAKRFDGVLEPNGVLPEVSRDRVRPSYVALAGFVLLYLSWQAFHWGPLSRQLAAGILGMPLSLAAVYAAWRASKRVAGSVRLRSAWRWVALALAAQAAGGLAALTYEDVLHELAYPSIADVLYLSFYPLLLVGVLRFPAAPRNGRRALELALDCAIVTLGGGAVFVYFIIGPNVLANSATLVTITSVAYPVGDVILLVALSTALLRGGLAGTRGTLTTMTVALGLFIVADLIYDYIVLHGTYHSGDPIGVMYMLAFACFTLAGLRQETVRASGGELAPSELVARTRVSWIPYLAIASSLGVVVASDHKAPLFPDLAIVAMATAVTGLVVTRQILSERSVRQSETQLAHAQGLAQLGSWEWNLRRDTIEHSAEDLQLYGLDAGAPAMTARQALEAVHIEDRDRVAQLIADALRNAKPFTYEMRIVRDDGEVRTLLTRGDVQTHAGRVVKVHGTHQDVTDRKRMESQLQYQADHDPLTGLYNRRRFAEELERILRYSARYNRPGALVMLDLDDFKFVNDTHGHAAGDAALKAFGSAISERVRGSDIVARLGGDEFAIVLPETDEPGARAIAEDIRVGLAKRAIDPPVHISGGIVAFDGEQDLIADDALIAADIALYEAKESGKDRICVYRGSGGAAVTWAERIRSALAEGRLVLYAQPMLDLKTGAITHRELLVRMISDDGELIPPDAFLPTAERFGLIGEIDRWVTREGLRLAKRGECVSINLSAHSIGDPEILGTVRQGIAAGTDPGCLVFEITESAAMTNMEQAGLFTEALTELGCQVALDDFGTGFGSFTYLKHLPTSYLKIDAEFVRDMVANATDRQVVNSITQVAHSLGKRTIAEGVEDMETLKALRDYGVDCAQGFFVGRPERIGPLTRMEQDHADHAEAVEAAHSAAPPRA